MPPKMAAKMQASSRSHYGLRKSTIEQRERGRGQQGEEEEERDRVASEQASQDDAAARQLLTELEAAIAGSGANQATEKVSDQTTRPASDPTRWSRRPKSSSGGGPSDTPPMTVNPYDSNYNEDFWTTEDDNRAVSRDIYIWRALTGIRNCPQFNIITSLLRMIWWRIVTYPVRMYFRPGVFLASILVLSGISYLLVQLPLEVTPSVKDICQLFILAAVQGFFLIWLLLYIFDVYKGLHYLRHNPDFQRGWLSGTVIRTLAVLRPCAVASLILLKGFVHLGGLRKINLLRSNMLYSVWSQSKDLSLQCALMDIVFYWLVGFAAKQGRRGLGQPWDVEVLLPWTLSPVLISYVRFLNTVRRLVVDFGLPIGRK